MNTTSNVSTTISNVWDDYSYGDESSMYDFYREPQIVFVVFLFVFIIVGNTCVLAAIQLSENGRKSRMNFFIMHLAIADLLVGLICVLTDFLSKLTIDWYAGNVMCKVIQYTQAVVTYASTYVLVSLSIDRYDAVARPMNFSRSAYQARVLISMAWLSSLLFALPAMFLYHESRQENRFQCWIDFPQFWHWQLFVSLVAVITFVLPALMIASCYVAIILIIWSKGHNYLGGSERKRLNTQGSIGSDRQQSGRGVIPQAKIRTIKMTLIIVIVFIICWSPFFVYNLLELFENIPVNDPLSTFIQSAAPLNSAANPIIYGIFSTRICRNLRRIRILNILAKTFCSCEKPTRHRGLRHNGHTTSLTEPTGNAQEMNGLRNYDGSSISLTSRRPSGLPVIRKTLTAKESLLLKTISDKKLHLNAV